MFLPEKIDWVEFLAVAEGYYARRPIAPVHDMDANDFSQ